MTPHSILILKGNRFHAEVLREIVVSQFPEAECVLVTAIAEARRYFQSSVADLFITGARSLEGDVIELLQEHGHDRAKATLVVTNCREYWIMHCLRATRINGIFDSSTEGPLKFRAALRIVQEGNSYWSPSVLKMLQCGSTRAASLCRQLTRTEQLVFSIIGDGSDDKAAATQLKRQPSYIQSVRREIHRKLGVRHKGELVRIAVSMGVVRLSMGSIVRPGLVQLRRACAARFRSTSS